MIISCNQNQSGIEKEYIKNLEEKNKVLEQELQELKSGNYQKSTSKGEQQKTGKSMDYFTIGSTEDKVLEVMGDPTSYRDMGSFGKIYYYEISSIEFKNGKVYSYSNMSDNLKVKVKK